jgi:hypothetical protein
VARSITMYLVCILTQVFSINRVPDANLSPNLSCWGNVVGRLSTNNICKWRVEKFISLEDFKDASNGYLVKSKCWLKPSSKSLAPPPGKGRVHHDGCARATCASSFLLEMMRVQISCSYVTSW